MKLDASALRALNLVEAPGNSVSILLSDPQCLSHNYILGCYHTKHDPVGFIEQMQNCTGNTAAWNVAETAFD